MTALKERVFSSPKAVTAPETVFPPSDGLFLEEGIKQCMQPAAVTAVVGSEYVLVASDPLTYDANFIEHCQAVLTDQESVDAFADLVDDMVANPAEYV